MDNLADFGSFPFTSNGDLAWTSPWTATTSMAAFNGTPPYVEIYQTPRFLYDTIPRTLIEFSRTIPFSPIAPLAYPCDIYSRIHFQISGFFQLSGANVTQQFGCEIGDFRIELRLTPGGPCGTVVVSPAWEYFINTTTPSISGIFYQPSDPAPCISGAGFTTPVLTLGAAAFVPSGATAPPVNNSNVCLSLRVIGRSQNNLLPLQTQGIDTGFRLSISSITFDPNITITVQQTTPTSTSGSGEQNLITSTTAASTTASSASTSFSTGTIAASTVAATFVTSSASASSSHFATTLQTTTVSASSLGPTFTTSASVSISVGTTVSATGTATAASSSTVLTATAAASIGSGGTSDAAGTSSFSTSTTSFSSTLAATSAATSSSTAATTTAEAATASTLSTTIAAVATQGASLSYASVTASALASSTAMIHPVPPPARNPGPGWLIVFIAAFAILFIVICGIVFLAPWKKNSYPYKEKRSPEPSVPSTPSSNEYVRQRISNDEKV